MWLSPLTVTPAKAREAKNAFDNLYFAANAHVYMDKAAGTPALAYSLAGRLVGTKSGWIILEVPMALVRGAFDALQESGAELPPPFSGYEDYKAHISVIRPEELKVVGGLDKITERGHYFKYTLGPVQSCDPDGWDEMSKVWFIRVKSPELEKLRKSYGLSSRPKNNNHDFHITIAVRRKHVLKENDVAKAAADSTSPYGEDCPVCGSPATSSCRCRIGNKGCDNGHQWHHCPVHKDQINMGTGHGHGFGCTCGTKSAEDSGVTAISLAPEAAEESIQEQFPELTDFPAQENDASQESEEESIQGPTLPWSGKEAAYLDQILMDLIKQAAVNGGPRHTLVTGHSGAGKSTLARALAERTGMPVYRIDSDPDFKDFLKNDPDLKHLEPEHPMMQQWHEIKRKAALRGLAQESPHIVEGTQLLGLTPEEIAQHRAVLVDTPERQVLRQRLARDRMKALTDPAKAERIGPPGSTKAKERARITKLILSATRPGVEAFRQHPGVETVPSRDINKWVARQPVPEAAVQEAMKVAKDMNEKRAATRVPLPVIGHYEAKGKVGRDAFLYQDPKGEHDNYAECSTCHDFTGKSCENFAKGNTVSPSGSCGLYHWGPTNRPEPGKEIGTFTKEEAGYVEHPVRCENCAYFDDEEKYCELFETLNEQFPTTFNLKKEVHPKGCCNAHIARGEHIEEEETQEAKTKTVAIDLDGTLAHYDGWRGEDVIGDPRPGAADVVKWLKKRGNTVILWTTRGNKERLKKWLKDHDIPVDHINENPKQPPNSSKKIIAEVYVDDRVIDARKSWPEIKKELAERLEK